MSQNVNNSDNFERFLALLEGSRFHDAGKKFIHEANMGFLSGTEPLAAQSLRGHGVAEGDEYLRLHSRNEFEHAAQQISPVEKPASPKGWIKAFSLFSRKEKTPETTITLGSSRKKTPGGP